jgi:quercetin dioxygenase-like cupin family protein
MRDSTEGTAMKRILMACVLLAAPALAGAPTSTPLAATDKTAIGQPIVSPEHPTALASIVVFQPGDKTVVHKHLYPHYGYMLEGVLTITNTETGKSFELKQGEFLVEMLDTYHTGENRGSVPVRLLVIDTVPQGATANSVAK